MIHKLCIITNYLFSVSACMSTPFKRTDIKKLAKKSGTTIDKLPLTLQDRETASLVLKASKKDKDMPALVFEWNDAGFNDVASAQGLRNGVAGQNKAAIVANLTINGAKSYNNVVFTFANGTAIGAWKGQISLSIPWARNQPGVPDVIISCTRINKITDRDIGTPASEYDLEDISDIFFRP